MIEHQIYSNIFPAGDKFFHADGGTDVTKLTVAFRNLANAPKQAGTHPQK
jgi:hypothetical protein